MIEKDKNVNSKNQFTALTNVGLAMMAISKAIDAHYNMPSMVGLIGPSGYGKSTAAAYVSIKYNTYYLEAKSFWNKKHFLTKLLIAMGIPEREQPATIAPKADMAISQLLLSKKPLIIDEFDHLLTNGMMELVRDLHDGARVPIMLIGEEQLAKKIKARSERFYSRVLSWQHVQPVNGSDIEKLCKVYSPKIKIEDDLQKIMGDAANGSARLIVNNISAITDFANSNNLSVANAGNIDLEIITSSSLPSRGRG